MIKPCSSSHHSLGSNFHPAGAIPPAAFICAKLLSLTPRGPGSTGHRPHDCAPLPEFAPGSPNAAMNCVEMRWNLMCPLILLTPVAFCEGVTSDAVTRIG